MDVNTVLTYVAFFALAGLTLLSALAVVTLRNLLRSALALVVTFIGVAGIYLLLQAEFIAAVQVLLYVGAVTVLILFAIMLTERLMEARLRQFTGKWWLAVPLVVLVLALIVASLLGAVWVERPKETLPTEPVVSLGEILLTRYVLPFEIASVLLLVAMVGAIVVAWPVRDRLKVVEEMEERVARAKAGWKEGPEVSQDETVEGVR